MLKINLPGSNSHFWIEDIFFSSLIENELYSTFYPYAKFESHKDIFLEARDVFITVTSFIYVETNQNFNSYKYNNAVHAYRIIFSIIRENIQSQNEFAYLHGAAISIERKVYFLLAKTGIGKTTFGVFVDQKNGICLTDDLIILHIKTKSVFPISKYAHIRENNKLILDINNSMNYNSIIQRYEYPLSEERMNVDWRLNCIVILYRSNDKVSTLKISSSPIIDLMDNMFLPYQIKNNISSAVEISECVPIYNLIYYDLESAKKLIQNL